MNTNNTSVEFNIKSSRLGKFLTLIMGVLMLGLTAAALVSDQGILSDGGLTIARPDGSAPGESEDQFEPLVRHLASVAKRTVRFSEPSEEADLYIHSLVDFLEARPRLGLVPLRFLARSGGARDAAVLFSTGAHPGPFDQLSPAEVVFTAPDDPNGFWAQLAWLRERGFQAPAQLSDFQFEGAGEHAIRGIFSVVWGRYKIGACRMSDLTYLLGRGLLHPGEVHIVVETAALPEMIISARPEDAGRLAGLLDALPNVLTPAGPGPRLFVTPIDEKALKLADRLVDDLAAGF